ncbi:MAG: RluA family pseudouridine synthase, partial [Clostridia bacterium]|nr:RluA family pseudouridine synthase [Clostridia bacterium]
MKKYSFNVSQKDKVLKMLQQSVSGYKYSQLEQALRKKDIIVNGVRIKQNVDVYAGDFVEIFLDDIKVFPYKVYYQDDNIIVFNKGKGIEVCDGDYNIQTEYQKQTGKQIFAVHRIDRNTLGLVFFAKTKQAERDLTEVFKGDFSKKYYYALVSGEPKQGENKLVGYLLKNRETSTVKIFNNKIAGSVKVETVYSVIKNIQDLSLLNVQISAGKTHQIRAHLAYNKLPILGDEKYGDTKINKLYGKKTQCLQAYKIEFDIPSNNKMNYLNK